MERKKYHPSSPRHRPALPAVNLLLPERGIHKSTTQLCFHFVLIHFRPSSSDSKLWT